MANYSMACTCGDTQTIEADSREAAVSMLKAGFTQEAVDHHMAEKHSGEKMTVEQAHGMIDQYLVAV